MTITELKSKIEALAPGTQAEVVDFSGENNHFRAVVVSPAFEGKTMLQQHRMVFDLLKDEVASNAVHALTLKTFTPDTHATRARSA